MSKREAYIVARMFYRLGQQLERAKLDHRIADAGAICNIIGRLEALLFEGEYYPFERGAAREAA